MIENLCDCFGDPRKGNVYIDPPALFGDIIPASVQVKWADDQRPWRTTGFSRPSDLCQYKFEEWLDEHDRELREMWEKRDEPRVYEPYQA